MLWVCWNWNSSDEKKLLRNSLPRSLPLISELLSAGSKMRCQLPLRGQYALLAANLFQVQIFMKLMTKMTGYNRCVWIDAGITKTHGLGASVSSALQQFANRGSPNSLRRIS